ncbi:hypothetical protein NITGR_550046 [Nitrospina gracilis 3/211]|uniref:Uncharacterized protein n=1 Tax=Nitrospina gracilis (strain 3/211) TaxID=1266370 RepID=M1YKM8_NITG3|nr:MULTISPECIES: hypothetical protein [Nitrospina]MCF8723922.1 hypothetical protein [Nitrospina sp. Nb-3]CCQ91044.1 hypothetical protein NITGR_550046 [Nitrospina gracilis 3/211]
MPPTIENEKFANNLSWVATRDPGREHVPDTRGFTDAQSKQPTPALQPDQEEIRRELQIYRYGAYYS